MQSASAFPLATWMVFSPQGLVFLAAALAITGVIVELIRRRYLRESYAMLWLAFAAVMIVLGLFPSLLFYLSDNVLHLYYLTTAGMICFLFLLAIILQYSVVLSRRADENRHMAQKMALLEERLERLEDSAAASDQKGKQP